MQIGWVATGEIERAATLLFLRESGFPLLERDEQYSIRHASLSFYPKLVFCEIIEVTTSGMYYVLIDPADGAPTPWWHVDGTNTPIYQANPSHLSLDQHTLVPYVAFFFSAVRGPHGLMPIIEHLQALPSGDVDDQALATLATLQDTVLPPRVLPSVDGQFQVAAAMMFHGAIFSVRLAVDSDGLVAVTDHHLVFDPGGESEQGDGTQASPEASPETAQPEQSA